MSPSKPEMVPVTLETVANGAVPEMVAPEIARVLKNLRDPNADAKKPRKIHVVLTWAPHADQDGAIREAAVSVQVKTTLAPPIAASSFVHLVGRGDDVEGYVNDVRQEEIDFRTGEVLPIDRSAAGDDR